MHQNIRLRHNAGSICTDTDAHKHTFTDRLGHVSGERAPPTPPARPLIANDRVNLTSYHEKFLADEVTLGQAFLQARRFSPTIIISPCPFIYIALTLRDLRN